MTPKLSKHIELVLLDRDGVINLDSADYIKSPSDWRAIDGSLEAIVRLQAGGIATAVCTNQAGIGRGIFTEDDLAAIHNKFTDELTGVGGEPLRIFYCSHHPDDACNCRKPRPGLLNAAMESSGVAPDKTVFIGDSSRDLDAAEAAGCTGLLVLTGNGRDTAAKRSAPTFSDLSAAVDQIHALTSS